LMLGAGVGSIALVSSPEQTEAGTPKHPRRALVLMAALALAAAVTCGIGATAAASTASAHSRQSFGAAARTAAGAAAESLKRSGRS
jgi:uncharacterized protein involved in exopolysaccharide biosynthesis